jgi:glycine/serine hydroxymethyltransferase
MKEPEMAAVADMIVDVLQHLDDENVLGRVRESVRGLCRRFPLYPEDGE